MPPFPNKDLDFHGNVEIEVLFLKVIRFKVWLEKSQNNVGDRLPFLVFVFCFFIDSR